MATKGNRGESVLGSYPDTYDIARIHGEKCLEFIFSIIENAAWNKESNGYATFVMRALKELWIAHPKDRDKIHKYLSKELRQTTPNSFNANAKTAYPRRDPRVSCSLFMEDMICENLGIEKKIYIDGDRKCKVIM